MKRVEVFFYGLFMDQEVLRAKGVQHARMQTATLRGFQLRIGRRATLEPAEGGIVYGMLASLKHADLELFYSDPSVSDYRPETVVVSLQSGAQRPALCFNLPTPPSAEEHNPEYAASLRALAQRLELPAEYVASIK